MHLLHDAATYKDYYNPETLTICHWKHQKYFIRKTKFAHLSFASPAIVDIARKDCSPNVTYAQIRNKLRLLGMYCHFSYTRKIFASYLHKCGVSESLIDLLHGRLSTNNSILIKHYLLPQTSFKTEITQHLAMLRKEIEN